MWKYFFLKRNLKLRWIFCAVSSIYIVLFTSLLEPLKNENYHYGYGWEDNIVAIGIFGLIITFFSIVLPYLFPLFFDEPRWRFSRFTLWFVGLILMGSIASLFLDFKIYGFDYNIKNIVSYFIDYQLYVAFFTLLPIVLFFYGELGIFYKFDKYALISNSDIQQPEIQTYKSYFQLEKSVRTDNDSLLVFFDRKGNKELEVCFDNVYYINSTDNYVDIIYETEKNKLERKTLRATLKSIEENNRHLPNLFRCHKAYIVNTQKVKTVKGNTKGYYLQLDNISHEIPVSRHKNTQLTHKLISF